MRVGIPTPLFSYTGQRAFVEATGKNLDELTRDLDRQFPGLRFRIVDEQDQLRPHVKASVNREQVKDLFAPLRAADEVAFIQAYSGG
jgi:molybdopterin converting factor small subunit